MKKNNYINFIFLILIFLFSCKNDKQEKIITASGKVLNEQTNQPISNIKIKLKEDDGGWGFFPVIDSTMTDINGYFSFSKKIDNGYDWFISINEYSTLYSTSEWDYVQPNVTNFRIIYLNPLATLDVHAQTTNPLGPNDTFCMNLPAASCTLCFDLITNSAIAGTYNKITWTVIRNGVTQNYFDSVYCKADTVTYYTINF